LDSLAARLNEPQVRKFIEPLIADGEVTAGPSYDDDLSYVRDLGPIRQSAPLAQFWFGKPGSSGCGSTSCGQRLG